MPLEDWDHVFRAGFLASAMKSFFVCNLEHLSSQLSDILRSYGGTGFLQSHLKLILSLDRVLFEVDSCRRVVSNAHVTRRPCSELILFVILEFASDTTIPLYRHRMTALSHWNVFLPLHSRRSTARLSKPDIIDDPACGGIRHAKNKESFEQSKLEHKDTGMRRVCAYLSAEGHWACTHCRHYKCENFSQKHLLNTHYAIKFNTSTNILQPKGNLELASRLHLHMCARLKP
ncbi:uncharacterized protein BJ212DRAFT_157065 [Suillus subaureus]|uniref:Uncharacterized protein n=1 Tax=Suillus subaureus TaxID=48587 RepID=A0A9P7ECY5_9AGAM|nr:uncharacterized protein BJ212DRAFT_157065 [Suillus subaureus]KAG1817206.1 hypothetical protein BJ212DRAFT_157065 [Suillus subaureus]